MQVTFPGDLLVIAISVDILKKEYWRKMTGFM
jgi:hypothetical protein